MSGFINPSQTENIEAVVDNSGLIGVTQFAHHKVHEDGLVTASHYDASVNTASPKNILISTPAHDVADIHIAWVISANGPGTVDVYEGATISANGTEINEVRNFRQSTLTPIQILYHGPTIDSDGTLLFPTAVIGSAGNQVQRTGGVTRQDSEFILKNGTNYIIRFTPGSDGTSFLFTTEYYEVLL